jgi:predicted MPP superfamily phosphohydrolase
MALLLSGSLSVERLTVKIPDLPTSLIGTTLVQMSDLHYDGLRLSEKMLEKAIALSNEANPDLVLLTGDYVTDDPSPVYELVTRLKHLQSRSGIIASLGNHDCYFKHSRSTVTEAFTSIGIKVLWNQIAYPLGEKLAIVGLADLWSRDFSSVDILNQIDLNIPRIVL